MADRLKVTELDFDAIKNNLKNFLRQQSEFQDYDFEGSGLNVLLDVLAYNTHYNAYYLNMVANESFLDSSLLRNSVVSHAKKLGYTPRSRRSAVALATITVDTGVSTPGTSTIPKGFNFVSNEVDGRSYNFTTLKSYSTSKTGNNFVFSNVELHEGQLVNFTHIQSNLNNPNQIITIPDSNIDTTTLKVSVYPSVSNTDFTIYTLSTNSVTVESDDTIYYLQEGINGNYEIYFGDDVFGKSIPDGSLVRLEYLTCNASLPNASNNFVTVTSIDGFTNIVVDSTQSASGGAERESVDEIKFAAPLQNISQNRAITKNDYIKLIQQRYPYFESVNVWGGEENDPPVYGKVFISAKPALGFEVTDTIKEYVKEKIIRPISILTVTPEIVDVDYNYLKVVTDVYFNENFTEKTYEELRSGVNNSILTYADVNLNKFNSYFNFNGLESTIKNYDKSIISNEVQLYVGKKFRPDLINPNTYVLECGFEIQRGISNETFYSTPDFGVLDEFGVVRNCFFEEIPSSYTGIESVTILNGGFNYLSTPTVEIIGDGQGAKAVATVVNGKVSKITVTNPGIGYTSATVRITGGGGSLAQANPILEGRFGRIRIAYYKPDSVTNDQTKIILNVNQNDGIIGEIDYKLGKITLTEFSPLSVNNDFGDITIFVKPKSNIIQSKLNKMLVLDENDPASVIVRTINTNV